MPHIKTKKSDRSGLSSTQKKKTTTADGIAPYADSLAHADFDVAAKPIWQVAEELASQIPDEEWAKVPHDGSAGYKERLYGVRADEAE